MTLVGPSGIEWFAELRVDGTVAYRLGRDDAWLFAEWADVGSLRCDRAGGSAVFTADPSADPKMVAKVQSGIAKALLRHLQGKLTLHGCAVAFGRSAIACIGPAGAGKSSAAAELCTRPGFALLSDDMARLELDDGNCYVTPSDAEHFLHGDAREALAIERGAEDLKVYVSASRVALDPARLRALVALEFADGDSPSLRRLRGHDLLATILPCIPRMLVDDPLLQARELAQLRTLCDMVPVYALSRPRQLSGLRAAGDLLENLMEVRDADR